MAGPTSQEIRAAMEEALLSKKHGGKIRRKFNAVVVFNVDGESFELNATAAKAADAKPALTVSTSLQVLQDLLDKKLTPQQAFMKGEIKVKGKMALAMKLQLILDATRKQLATASTIPVSRL